MAKLDFQNKTLEKLFRSWKWSRNNTLQMLEAAVAVGIMDYKPAGKEFLFEPIRHQFQCLVTTTDTYYRHLTNADNQSFGILVHDGKVAGKHDLSDADISERLASQITELEHLLGSYDNRRFEQDAKSIQAIFNHEYLHHGQLLIMFREAGVDVPERFKKAFAL